MTAGADNLKDGTSPTAGAPPIQSSYVPSDQPPDQSPNQAPDHELNPAPTSNGRPTQGSNGRGNTLGDANRRKTDQHKAIWPVLQGLSARLIAAYRRDNPPSARQKAFADRLDHLLDLSRQGRATPSEKAEIRDLRNMRRFL
jgi:hypothetical protein